MTADANVPLPHSEVKKLPASAFEGSADLREFGARMLELMINALMSPVLRRRAATTRAR